MCVHMQYDELFMNVKILQRNCGDRKSVMYGNNIMFICKYNLYLI